MPAAVSSSDVQLVVGLAVVVVAVIGGIALAKGLVRLIDAPFIRSFGRLVGLPREAIEGQIDPDPDLKYSGKQLIAFGLAMECSAFAIVLGYQTVDGLV